MTPRKIWLLVLTLSLVVLGATQASAQGMPIYNNIPNPLPGNLASIGYDSLNVAVSDPASSLSVGGNPAPDDAYFNDNYGFNYCDGGAGGVNTFRLDAGCWTGFKPATQFNAANPPATKDDCKGDGWKTRTNASGQPFPNQGQCVQYFNTGK